MRVENPAAFSFIMQDEIYLLNSEKSAFGVHAVLQPVLETVAVNFNYLGKHKKNFLIIVHYPAIAFMAERHLAALESTLKRLEISLDDIAIFNRAEYPEASFEQVTSFFSPQKLLVLGTAALPEDIDGLMLNKIQQTKTCTSLLSFSFDEMMDNTENKKAFWEQMKQL